MGADLNPRDNLYAGSCARYMVETGFLTVQSYLASPHIVCFSLTGLKFLKPIHKGMSVKMTGTVVDAGRTSVGVYMEMTELLTGVRAAEGFLTFVSIAEETQRPVPHHKVFPGVSDAMAAKRRQYLALKAVR